MNARNFDGLMQEQILKHGGERLLLHCCCAPCSSACLEKLHNHFKITVLFYNPNIEDEEYEKRKNELLRFIKETGWADFIDCDHDKENFYSAIKGLEDCKEGGARCEKCFTLRLEKTRDVALKEGFPLFGTTLTLSPLKNAKLINEIGERLGGDRWLYSDFKKRDGYLRSLKLSREHNLYRQNYCGCVFSKDSK
ncbi:MAG: epoxyqueuosine reductase QueH [Clostridia bacterium]|nr:epoxyqueuosine reductase QueH [Clostridia bacterium]